MVATSRRNRAPSLTVFASRHVAKLWLSHSSARGASWGRSRGTSDAISSSRVSAAKASAAPGSGGTGPSGPDELYRVVRPSLT